MKQVCVIGLMGNSLFLTVDHFHLPEETLVANAFYQEPGGKGYNQACMLGVLGANCCFISIAGQDESAEKAIRYLQKQKVTPVVEKIEHGQTALAVICTNKEGENQVTVYPGVSNMMTKEMILKHEEIIKTSKYLLLQLELPFEAMLEAAKLGKKHGVTVVLNPAPYRYNIDEILPYVDIITPNEEEFKHLDLAKCYEKHVIVTLGKKGAKYYYQKQLREFKAPNVENVVDTTGAGDIFNASLVYNLLNDETINTAITKALNHASQSVTSKYVLPSIEKFK